MNYIYRILGHDEEQRTLQVKLSCMDVPHTGVVQMQYPTSIGVPTFSDAKLLEHVLLYFKGDLDYWEMWENNKDRIGAILNEADALVGKTQAFDHTIMDDEWFADELD